MKQNAIDKFKEIFNIKSKITYKKLLDVIDNLILLGNGDDILTYHLEIQESGIYINYTFDCQDSDIDCGKYNHEDFYINPYTDELWCKPLDRALKYENYQFCGKGKNNIEAIIELFLDIYYTSNNIKYDLMESINDTLT